MMGLLSVGGCRPAAITARAAPEGQTRRLTWTQIGISCTGKGVSPADLWVKEAKPLAPKARIVTMAYIESFAP
jgi:hypothetical protein